MSIGGMAVDPVRTAGLEQLWTEQVSEGRAKADIYFKRKEIKRGPNPRVEITKDLKRLREDVAKELGDLCPRTEASKLHPDGCAKTDAETLELCQSPAIKALADMAEAEKLLNAFLPVLKQGVVHPSYDILKATGRTSSFGPNIQQLPRKGGVRECFVAREGNCFIECLVPGTRILTTNLEWVPIEQLVEGNTLIGFDESLGSRESKFRESAVINNRKIRKPCYKITTSRGVVTASDNHAWVARRDFAAGYRGVRGWIATKDLKIGDCISFFADPWTFDSSYEGGWLSGILDGEGYVGKSGHCLGYGQNDGLVFEKSTKLFQEKGFVLHSNKNKQGCNQVLFRGEKASLRALGTFRPLRLLQNSRQGRNCWEGRSTWGKRSTPAVVLSIEFVGEQDVYALQTTTKTFIAEGFLSHNCDYASIELCALSQVCLNLFGKSTMAEAINSGKDLHLVTAARILNRPYETLDKRDPAVKDARQLSKAANFGYPGGMGPEKFCLYAKASYGLSITLSQSAQLRAAWMAAYPEMKTYFDYISEMTRAPWELKQHVSGRIRGGCGFCDGANSLFQGLAADGAKAGLYLVAREAYRHDSTSPLRGAFGGAFIHDEQILEISLDKAPLAGVRLGELMVTGMKAYIPDVLVKAEPVLMQRWYKEAEPKLSPDGQLVPWTPTKG
jgi:DNA polymerase-1